MKALKYVLFYFLSFTWGIIMTLIGAVAAIVLLIAGASNEMFYQNVHFTCGSGWGGVNFGPFFITQKNTTLKTKQHEGGHGVQNIILGPLMPFVVAIPSGLRYQLRNRSTQKKKYIFASLVSAGILILGLALLIPGIVCMLIPLIVIGALVAIYAVIIALWLLLKEIPQYADGATVDYYKIWFEANASKLGEKFYPDEEQDTTT